MLKRPVLLKRNKQNDQTSKSANTSPLVTQIDAFGSFPPSLPYSYLPASASMPNIHPNTHHKKVSLSSSILSQTQQSVQFSDYLDQAAYKTESILTDMCPCSECQHDHAADRKPNSTPTSRCTSPILEDHDEWIASTILNAVKTKEGEFQWDI